MIWKRKSNQHNDQALFNRLAAEQIDALHRTAYRLTNDVSEAEDLTQEVFLKAWNSIGKLQGMPKVRPWLFRVLRNAWLDRLRKKARRPQLVGMDEPPEDVSPEPVPVLSKMEDREAWNEHFDTEVLEAIEELSDGERLVLLYHTFGELSYKEIAEALECPLGTVMSRLHRARARLQQRLIDYAARQGITKKEGQDCAEA